MVINLTRTTEFQNEHIHSSIIGGHNGYHLEVNFVGEPIDKDDYAEIVKHMTAIKKIYDKIKP